MILTDYLTDNQLVPLYQLKLKVAKQGQDSLTHDQTKQLGEIITYGLQCLFNDRINKPFIAQPFTDTSTLDLKQIQIKPIIDFIVICIETVKPTNGHTIHKEIGLKSTHVKPLESKNSSRFFAVTIHNITKRAQIEAAINKISKRFPLASAPTIKTLELSYDFYGQSCAFLAQMVQSLYIEPCSKNIRLYSEHSYQTKYNPCMPYQNLIRYFERGYNFGIGHRNDTYADKFRAYFKTTDNNQQPIEVSKHRPRIEVNFSCNNAPLAQLNNLVREGFKKIKFNQYSPNSTPDQQTEFAYKFEPKSQRHLTVLQPAKQLHNRLNQRVNDFIKRL